MVEERIVEQRAGARLVEPDVSQYPDSDGLPMAENDEHCRAILSIRGPLEVRFQGSPSTYITGDLLLYYEEDGVRKSVAPDVMVVRGVSTGPRRTYVLRAEGKPPDFVAEVSSPSSRRHDRTSKRALYAKLGVREYFLFDPVYEEPGHDGALQGYRLWGSESVEMGPGGGAELRSEVLGLSLRPEGKRVRLRDLATGQDLLWFEETENARRAAERQRNEEAGARRAAERQRDEAAGARRAAERQRDEAAGARRAAERQRDEAAGARRAAEARVAELEALLRASNTPSSKGTRR
jgi:Uma2 family endonuclease